MALKTLSAFNYYGGKAKLAPLICDMLDYKNTDIYIEPFGGGARVLLNKPQHTVEIYNDSSAGLCAFMNVMSNKDSAYELIEKLYDTEYSAEEFYNALLIRNEAEDRFIDEFKRQAFLYLKQLIQKYDSNNLVMLKESIKRKKADGIFTAYDAVVNSHILEEKELDVLERYKKLFNEYMDIYREIVLRAYKEQYRINFNSFKVESKEKLKKQISSYVISLSGADKNGVSALNKKIADLRKIELYIDNMTLRNIRKDIKKKLRKLSYDKACEIAYYETSNNHDDINVNDIDLAVATYVIYSQSRDGMGKDWSSSKYKSTDDYHRQINRLYDVAERLEGVCVTQVGALAYILKCSYLNNERAMLYLDPSYLDTEDEKKNLGTVYKESFSYEDHETLLKAIYKAKCKILISNYDTELYNKYLSEKNGWRKVEFQTTTSVGGKKDNKRIEVLWYNY